MVDFLECGGCLAKVEVTVGFRVNVSHDRGGLAMEEVGNRLGCNLTDVEMDKVVHHRVNDLGPHALDGLVDETLLFLVIEHFLGMLVLGIGLLDIDLAGVKFSLQALHVLADRDACTFKQARHVADELGHLVVHGIAAHRGNVLGDGLCNLGFGLRADVLHEDLEFLAGLLAFGLYGGIHLRGERGFQLGPHGLGELRHFFFCKYVLQYHFGLPPYRALRASISTFLSNVLKPVRSL